jgi:hypothetical protein
VRSNAVDSADADADDERYDSTTTHEGWMSASAAASTTALWATDPISGSVECTHCHVLVLDANQVLAEQHNDKGDGARGQHNALQERRLVFELPLGEGGSEAESGIGAWVDF